MCNSPKQQIQKGEKREKKQFGYGRRVSNLGQPSHQRQSAFGASVCVSESVKCVNKGPGFDDRDSKVVKSEERK